MGLFERNLNRSGQTIDIQTRVNKGASFGNVKPDQTFTTKHTAVKTLVQTPRGKVTFDDVGLDEIPTHRFCLSFLTGITQEDWILFKGKKYDILNVVNHCEKDKQLQLFARVRGTGDAAQG